MAGIPNPGAVRMDARAFVRAINRGAQAKVVFFEHIVDKMAEQAKRNLVLASLDANTLIYEDKDTNIYYLADWKKQPDGMIEITNHREIQVVEEEKSGDFNDNINSLVDAIAEGKTKEADKYFKWISSQRFRPTVIPESGYIYTRDNQLRKVSVARSISEGIDTASISKAFYEAISDKIEINEGRIISGSFSDQKFVLPVNEFTHRRVRANDMRTVAKNAYRSNKFNDLVYGIAGFVSTGKIEEAVKLAKAFCIKEQEFSLLSKAETLALIENSLATKNEYNSFIAEDVAKVFHRVAVRANRNDIIKTWENWENVARLANEATVLNAVQVMAESKNFEADYENFLDSLINEGNDILSARAKAYTTSLKMIVGVLANIKGQEQQVDKIKQMITKLETGDQVDTDTILNAEKLVSSIHTQLVNKIQNLETFDTLPGQDVPTTEEEPDLGNAVSMPEVDLGSIPGPETGAPDLGGLGDMGGAVPEMAGAPDMGAPAGAPPAPAGAPAGLPESIEVMSVRQLSEELEGWKIHGPAILAEGDFAEVGTPIEQMDKYIKRCIELGDDADSVREEFELLRDHLVYTGELPVAVEDNDPYADWDIPLDVRLNATYNGVVESKEQGKDGVESSSVKEMDPATGNGKSAGKGAPASGPATMDSAGGKGVQNKTVKSSGLPQASTDMKKVGGKGLAESACGLDSPTGNGLVEKGVKASDMRSGLKSAGAGGPPGGDPKMVSPSGEGIAKKSVAQSDMRSGGSTAGNSGLEGGDKTPAKPDDGVQKKVGGKKSIDGLDAPEGTGLAEDQFKTGTKGMKQRGLKKAAIANSKKGTTSGVAKEELEVSVTDSATGETLSIKSQSSFKAMLDKIVASMDDEGTGGLGGELGGVDAAPALPGAEGDIPGDMGAEGDMPGDMGAEGDMPGDMGAEGELAGDMGAEGDMPPAPEADTMMEPSPEIGGEPAELPGAADGDLPPVEDEAFGNPPEGSEGGEIPGSEGSEIPGSEGSEIPGSEGSMGSEEIPGSEGSEPLEIPGSEGSEPTVDGSEPAGDEDNFGSEDDDMSAAVDSVLAKDSESEEGSTGNPFADTDEVGASEGSEEETDTDEASVPEGDEPEESADAESEGEEVEGEDSEDEEDSEDDIPPFMKGK